MKLMLYNCISMSLWTKRDELYVFAGTYHLSEPRLWAAGGMSWLIRSALCGVKAAAGSRRSQHAVGGARPRGHGTAPTTAWQLYVNTWQPGETLHQEKSPEVTFTTRCTDLQSNYYLMIIIIHHLPFVIIGNTIYVKGKLNKIQCHKIIVFVAGTNELVIYFPCICFMNRKHNGESLVCDESIYSEDSGNNQFHHGKNFVVFFCSFAQKVKLSDPWIKLGFKTNRWRA